jgi:hypothetical protein
MDEQRPCEIRHLIARRVGMAFRQREEPLLDRHDFRDQLGAGKGRLVSLGIPTTATPQAKELTLKRARVDRDASLGRSRREEGPELSRRVRIVGTGTVGGATSSIT